MLRQIECIASGRVQGVFYRDFARRKASGLGLVGLVENLSDGTVHTIAQGNDSDLRRYIDDLKRGSMFSSVDEVKAVWSNVTQAFNGFRIKYRNLADYF